MEWAVEPLLIAFIFVLWLTYDWVTEIYPRSQKKPSAELFCPVVEERTPLADDYRQNVVWEDEKSAYGYECEVCGNVHVFDFGIAPGAIYVGDKIRLKFPSDGMVQAELHTD